MVLKCGLNLDSQLYAPLLEEHQGRIFHNLQSPKGKNITYLLTISDNNSIVKILPLYIGRQTKKKKEYLPRCIRTSPRIIVNYFKLELCRRIM